MDYFRKITVLLCSLAVRGEASGQEWVVHAPRPKQTRLNIKRTKSQVRIAEPAGKATRASLVAACTQTSGIVLPAHVGFLKASFAVDTSASVNVLSEESYLALKDASRGGLWPLKPIITNILGVLHTPFRILGVVWLG